MQTRSAAVLAALIVLVPIGARAQAGAYVATLGKDTVAVERFTLTPTSLTGTSVVRAPRTLVRDYELALGADGAPRRLQEVVKWPDGSLVQEITYDYSPADSVILTVHRDTTNRRVAVAVAGQPLPFFEDLYGPTQIALRRAAGDSLTLMGGRQPLRLACSGTAAWCSSPSPSGAPASRARLRRVA